MRIEKVRLYTYKLTDVIYNINKELEEGDLCTVNDYYHPDSELSWMFDEYINEDVNQHFKDEPEYEAVNIVFQFSFTPENIFCHVTILFKPI